MRRVPFVQLASYGLVMAVGTGLDVVCVTLLRRTPGVPLLLAVGCGFLANVVSGYLLGRRFVFRSARHTARKSMPRYAVVVALNVLVAIGGVTLLVSDGLPYLGARVLASVLLVPLNYVAMRSWVFLSA
jgi:putative flippase GtrA